MSERNCHVIAVTVCPTCRTPGQAISTECEKPATGHEVRTMDDGSTYWVRPFAYSVVSTGGDASSAGGNAGGTCDYDTIRRKWLVSCPACGGHGILREATQAWDVANAPVPTCPHCVEGVLDLANLLHAAAEYRQTLAEAPVCCGVPDTCMAICPLDENDDEITRRRVNVIQKLAVDIGEYGTLWVNIEGAEVLAGAALGAVAEALEAELE